MIIYVIGQGREQVRLNIDGLSSRPYPFDWNPAANRYEYVPKSDEESEDIFQSQNAQSIFYFSATDGGVPSNAKPATPRTAMERRYYEDLPAPGLLALAKDCGLEVPAGTDRDVVLLMLDAYWLGAGYKKVYGEPKQPAELEMPDVGEPEAAAERPRRGRPRKLVEV